MLLLASQAAKDEAVGVVGTAATPVPPLAIPTVPVNPIVIEPAPLVIPMFVPAVKVERV